MKPGRAAFSGLVNDDGVLRMGFFKVSTGVGGYCFGGLMHRLCGMVGMESRDNLR